MAQELTPRDDALLKAAADGWSGERIEQELGIPAAKAVLRTKQILASNDVWTDIERRQILMYELTELKNKIQKQTEKYIDDKMGEVLLKTIKAIDEILDKTSKVSDDQLSKISRAQAGAMLQLIKAAFDAAKGALAQEYPDADMRVIEAKFNDALQVKFEEIAEA